MTKQKQNAITLSKNRLQITVDKFILVNTCWDRCGRTQRSNFKLPFTYIKVRRCGMIANESLIHQSSNEMNVNNYRQPSIIRIPIPYRRL